MKKLYRWLYALAILMTGVLASIFIARWAKTALGLPTFIVTSRSGSESDLVELVLMAPLLIGYFYVVPKLVRVDHGELRRMLSGE